MKCIRQFVVAVAFVLCCDVSVASPPSQWKFGFSTQTFATLGDACNFNRTANGWSAPDWMFNYDSPHTAASTCGSYTNVSCGIYYVPNGTTMPIQATASCVVQACDWAGFQASGSQNPAQRWGMGSKPAHNAVFCHPVYNCKGQMSGPLVSVGSSWIGEITYSNANCTNDTDPAGDAGSSCAAGSFGTVCKTGDGMNVNGDTVSDDGSESGCTSFASGGTMCVVPNGTTPSSPPLPDSGTPGTPATPTASVTNTTTNHTTNYYNQTTITNSSTPINSVPAPGGSQGAPGNGDGNGTGLDDDGCTEDDGCTGELPALDDGVCTFGECAQEFFDRVSDAPLVASVIGAANSIPAGTCPTWDIEVFDSEYSLSAPICSLWEDISPLLSAIFLVLWAWVAARIVLSA